MKYIFKGIVTVLIVNFLVSCSHSQLDVDTSKIEITPIVFKRLDKDVFSLTQQNVNEKTLSFQAKYNGFYNRYIKSIINNGGVVDSGYVSNILKFVSDKDMMQAYDDILKIYSDNDVELLGDKMTEVVKRFKLLFPNRKTPKQFVTFMSGFNYNVVYADSTLGISLDMYLGSNNGFYGALQFPRYKTRTMNKDYVLSDAVRGWIITEFDNSDPVNNLLSHMIFYGKIFYVCDGLLPNVEDSVKIAYTSAQMKYCNNYEQKLWNFIAKDNKLYANDLKIVGEYTNDGPNSASSISKECPPRIAMWLGWQVVKSYMKHNEEVSVEELMNEKDFQKILAKSKYRP